MAILGIVVAAMLAQTGDDGSEILTSGEDVERLIPSRGAEILAQEAVGIDLAPGFTAVLILNGVEIPEDQLNRRQGVNEILYRASEDDAIVEYQAGENCMVALVWPVEETRAEARPVSWCFNVT
ncbi:MAG: hypothetical protein AAGK32_10750 [Actinomycetota bacterium]